MQNINFELCFSVQGGNIFDKLKVFTMWQSPFKIKELKKYTVELDTICHFCILNFTTYYSTYPGMYHLNKILLIPHFIMSKSICLEKDKQQMRQRMSTTTVFFFGLPLRGCRLIASSHRDGGGRVHKVMTLLWQTTCNGRGILPPWSTDDGQI